MNHSAAIMITHSHAAASTADRVVLLDANGLHPRDVAGVENG
jgi:ABC-type lipoprotein export system ATPase subunit